MREEESQTEEDASGPPRWQLKAIQAVVRVFLQVFAGIMIANGFGSSNFWDTITGILVVLATLSWAVYCQWNKQKQEVSKDTYE